MITSPPLAALSATLLASTFTVNDDGPADFASIADAISSPTVVDGDVLAVEPGSYAGFTLGKALNITGRGGAARPMVTGKVQVTSVPRFELVRLEIAGLMVQFVSGAGTVEDCVVTGSSAQQIGFIANHCDQLSVSRSTVSGLSPSSGNGGVGMLAVQSCVSLSGNTIRGGDGGPGVRDGGTAVRVIQAHQLLFAGGALLGGAAGSAGGDAGDGLQLLGSEARVRGSMFDAVLPGAPGAGNPGVSFALQDGSTLVLGPVLSNGISESGAPNTTVIPSVNEPFLRNVGSNDLGTTGEIDLFGPAGALALLLIAEDEAVVPVPELEGDLWLDPSSVLFLAFLVTHGNMFPEPCVYSIPSAPVLAARSFRSQAAFPGVAGALDPTKIALSNAVDIIVRP